MGKDYKKKSKKKIMKSDSMLVAETYPKTLLRPLSIPRALKDSNLRSINEITFYESAKLEKTQVAAQS